MAHIYHKVHGYKTLIGIIGLVVSGIWFIVLKQYPFALLSLSLALSFYGRVWRTRANINAHSDHLDKMYKEVNEMRRRMRGGSKVFTNNIGE